MVAGRSQKGCVMVAGRSQKGCVIVAGRSQKGCVMVAVRSQTGCEKVISQCCSNLAWSLQNYVVITSLHNVIMTKK